MSARKAVPAVAVVAAWSSATFVAMNHPDEAAGVVFLLCASIVTLAAFMAASSGD